MENLVVLVFIVYWALEMIKAFGVAREERVCMCVFYWVFIILCYFKAFFFPRSSRLPVSIPLPLSVVCQFCHVGVRVGVQVERPTTKREPWTIGITTSTIPCMNEFSHIQNVLHWKLFIHRIFIFPFPCPVSLLSISRSDAIPKQPKEKWINFQHRIRSMKCLRQTEKSFTMRKHTYTMCYVHVHIPWNSSSSNNNSKHKKIWSKLIKSCVNRFSSHRSPPASPSPLFLLPSFQTVHSLRFIGGGGAHYQNQIRCECLFRTYYVCVCVFERNRLFIFLI